METMQSKYDVIIIGSGLGGLTCGYILSKNGYKVALFEQGVQLGGCLQTFTRKGVKFETGMHYIGDMQEGGTLNQLFKYLSLSPGVKVSALDPDGFDVISLKGERYKFANGYANFVDTLAENFPSERENLNRYAREISDIARRSSFFSFKDSDRLNSMLPESVKNSVNDFIGSITSNKRLQNVLAGNLALYAGVKDKTPLYIHAFINDFYINGAYRIIGGSDQIATSLENSIRSYGGEIYTSSKVVKINCNQSKAVSILLANGAEIATDYIISNTAPEVTIDMIDSPLIRPIYRTRISQLEHTVSNFTIYMQFKKNTVPYMNSNYFYYKGDEVWGGEQYTQEEWPRNFLYVHMCPAGSMQYAQVGEVISYMRFDEMEKWVGTSVGRRGEEYEAFKKEKAEKLLDILEKEFPGTKANIESYYTSTPLTYLDYTGTVAGSMYGILHDINAPVSSRISHRTKIPNLFMTGQNINAHGIMGVIISACISCSDLLGREFLLKQITEA